MGQINLVRVSQIINQKQQNLFAKRFVPALLVFVFLVSAVGLSSVFGAASVPISFNDYSQCSNDDGDGFATADVGCRWINGSIQSSNSTYNEGDATVQRLLLEDITPGEEHTVTFKYGTTKGGKHAYDFLTDDTFSELAPNTISNADMCDGAGSSKLPSCASITPALSALIPTDPMAGGFDTAQANRHFKIRNGTITNVSIPTVVSGSYAGDSETSITLTFTVPSSCVDSYKKQGTDVCAAMITFGAHISKGSDWGPGTTAVNINGAPYHVSLEEVDGSSFGSRDNQMQANTIDVTPHLTLAKHVINDNGGTANASAWTLAATGTGGFSGTGSPATGPDATRTAEVTAGTQYTLSESGGPSGYSASSWVCTGGGTFVAPNKITLAAAENVTCTITNNDQAAHLIVIKNVVNGNGGTVTADQWNMNIVGVTAAGGNSFSGAESGVNKTLSTVGQYTVSESGGPSGYTQTSASADCSGTITLGQTKTCTLTNDDNTPSLTLIKHLTKDNGGTAVASNWTLTASGPTGFSGAGPSVSNGLSFDAGSYDLSESGGPTGYTASDWVCVGGNQNDADTVTVGLGQSVTCTITNNDDAPSLTLRKVVVTDNGGTAVESDWTLTAAGPTGFSGAGPTVLNDASFDAGSYDLSEAGPTGYAASSWACVGGTQNDSNTITVSLGQSATCTITNDDVAPRLTLVKTVTKDNGGTALPTDWTLSAAGTTPISGTTGSVSVTNAAVSTGVYSLSENSGPVGYTASTYSCIKNDGAPIVSNTITLGLADNATCTINNNDDTPSLTLNKIVVKDNGGTAVESDWTLNAAGPTAFSGLGAAGSTDVTSGSNFSAGTYTLSESAGPSGYSPSDWTCIGGDQNGNQITVSLGQSATCTITNDDIQPKLTLTKIVLNGNGGQAEVSDFPLFVNSTGVTSGAQNGFNAGSYAASETNKPSYTAGDWDGDCAADGSVTLNVGDVKACTITNDDQPGTLIVKKIVINDDGGNKKVQDFSFVVNDGSATAFEGDGQNNMTVDAGVYAVTEPSVTGYATTYEGCSDIAIANGETKTCTITNDDIAPKLTLVKVVKNDYGGNAVVSDFPLFISGDSTDSGVTKTLSANTLYTATETNLAGYTASGWTGDCAVDGTITLLPGDDKTCTITNQDQPAKIILNKVVTNNSGGDAGINDFGLSVGGTTVSSGSTTNVNSNTAVALNEAGRAGYSFVSLTGAAKCPSTLGGNTTLNEGEIITCTITNDDIPGTLKIVKNTTGGDGQFNFTVAGPTASTPSITTSNGTGSVGPSNVNAGTYSVAETVPDGWTLSSATCDDGSPVANLQLSLGENVVCTFTNNKKPKLTIVKVTNPTNDDGKFNLSINGTPYATDVGDGGSTNAQFAAIGANTFSEAAGASTDLANYVSVVSGEGCGGSATAGTITLAAGDDKTCTITNTRKGRIIVDKVTNPAGDQQSFDFTAIGDGYTGFSLTDSANPNNQQVAPGAYSISEGAVAGWDSDGGSCDNGETPASLDVEPGETVTCTFTNTKLGSLTIVKDAQPGDLIDFQFGGGLGNFLLDDDADVVGIGANGDIDRPQSKVFAGLVPASYGVSETMPNAFWSFGGVSCVLTGTATSYPSTTSGTGVTVNINPGADVTCTFVNTKQSPTRTQGFWQTHTAYTSGVFAAKFPTGMQVGSGSHKGIITNNQGAGLSQLFGAYFSNIAKKTDGKQRAATDKARMVLLQQLITAKLNCANFGCAASVQTLIASGDTAYAGTNTSAMSASTGLLDAYNNSGDTITIGSVGKATPSGSKLIADLTFWNLP